MSKKDFIALADAIRHMDTFGPDKLVTLETVLDTLADFCQSQNPRFMRDRWLGYIAGKNGKNGGKVAA